MKKLVLLTFMLFFSWELHAQEQDSISFDTSVFELSPMRDIDGYLFDMNALGVKPTMVQLQKKQQDLDYISKNFSKMFSLNSKTTYTSGLYSINNFSTGFGHSFISTDLLHSATFRLHNGWKINTYGQYDQYGRRMHSTSALPWERDQFKGAFELKSANGHFGIRLEVKSGGREW